MGFGGVGDIFEQIFGRMGGGGGNRNDPFGFGSRIMIDGLKRQRPFIRC